MRNLSRLQNNLLTLGAVLGALCLVAALTGILLGAKPLVFRSGSMAPTIATGALGVSLPVDAQEIRTGDIISVENTAGVRITHRVVTSDVSQGTATLTLKGDANAVVDPQPYVLQTADRVVFTVPLLGYAVAWLSSSVAVFVGGLFTAYLLYVAFGSRQGKRRDQPPHDEEPGDQNSPGNKAGRRSRHKAVSVLATIVLIPVGALHASAPSQAAFMDTASATGSFTARSLQAPALTCTTSGNDVIMTLTQPGDFGTNYELKSTMPMRTWRTGTWTPGAIVSVTIDADDPMITSPQARNVTFTAANKFSAWSSALTSKVVYYTPAIGLVPAKVACV
jgi:signal peptidase